MQAYGLRPPGQQPAPINAALPPVMVGGVMSMQSAASMRAQDKATMEREMQAQQAQPVISSLAGQVNAFWSVARTAKEQIERVMLDALRARRGEYSPEMKQQLTAQNSSMIYMMLFSTKCRQASSLLRDVLLGAGTEKPWTLHTSPVPDLPLNEVAKIAQSVSEEVFEAEQAGIMVTVDQIKERLRDAKATLEMRIADEADARCARMEKKMEDQLVEGDFLTAFDQFIDDLTTFKTAFIKGPVIRRKPVLKWGNDGGLTVLTELVLEWERVDPFMMYPAPWARHINDGPLIERHRLSREQLSQMIGVEGYSEVAIRTVLDLYGTGGLNNWLMIDSAKATAEGRDGISSVMNTGLIDALQYWGSVSGKLLREWGMSPEEVPDEAKEYQVEAWLIGGYIIKAAINADPLGRRGYYADSYERIPGTLWGNSLHDLVRDTEDMCNAAARALANNLGIASGPQVVVNVDRLPVGENITTLYPWKIHQVTSDPMGSTAKAIDFFQPSSHAAELMGVYEKFSNMADEYSGIPKYTVGAESAGGAGRTASGMSMMLGNASKIIKQVVSGIDTYILKPVLERLFIHNMRYGTDPDLKGDVNIVARGALSLTTKESAQVRRNEFLNATANPFDMQIMGMEGRAEVLRSAARTLDLNTDKVVPPLSVLRQRAAVAAQQQAQAAMAAPVDQPAAPGGEQLMDGAPVTDNFSSQPQ